MFSARSKESELTHKVVILESGRFMGEEAEISSVFPLDESRAIYYLDLKRGGTFEVIDQRKNPKKIQYLSPNLMPVSSP